MTGYTKDPPDLFLFVDDERKLPPGPWTAARTYETAIQQLQTGRVRLLSLDHDMGLKRNATSDKDLAKTGYDVICWIERQVVESGFDPPTITCHSANPIGRERIMSAARAIQRLRNRL